MLFGSEPDFLKLDFYFVVSFFLASLTSEIKKTFYE